MNPNEPIPSYSQPTPGAIGGGLVGGLLGAAAGFYDTYQSNKTARENTNKTIAAQKREAELAYQRQVEMWHMQNAYNTPEAQMARFKAAGLNPHLIYGQGNPGNASDIPKYQPADLQYKYGVPAYGASVASVLPTLMSVGTWMQNLRSSEIDNQLKLTNTQKAEQMVGYLEGLNPMLLQERKNRLSLFPYQKDATRLGASISAMKFEDLRQDFRYKYGEDLYGWLPWESNAMSSQGMREPLGGAKRLEFLQRQAQLQQSLSKAKLLEAQASWTDFDITNPQAIIQMVLGGVMGLAGQQLRMSTFKGGSKNIRGKERPRGLVRRRMGPNHPDR